MAPVMVSVCPQEPGVEMNANYGGPGMWQQGSHPPAANPEIVTATVIAPPQPPNPATQPRKGLGWPLVVIFLLVGVLLALVGVVAYQATKISTLEKENRDLLVEREVRGAAPIHGEVDDDDDDDGDSPTPPPPRSHPQPQTPPPTPPPTPPRAVSPGKRGVTWVVVEKDRIGTAGKVEVLSRASCHSPSGQCDAYKGDTPCTESLPLLCLKTESLAQPSYTIPQGRAYYEGWTGGRIGVTKPVLGSTIRSLSHADELCSQDVGAGYKWADHHDGGGGWNWWAYGSVPAQKHFWTRVKGQSSACFD